MKIYISYRRKAAIDIAARVKNFFQSKGFDVFYDISSLKIGRFDEQIYSYIRGCDYFIPILSQGAIDDCIDENDWMRKEIEFALNNKKMILPLLLPGFEFPSILPTTIEELRYYNGWKCDSYYIDLVLEKINTLIQKNTDSKSIQNGILCNVEINHICRAEAEFAAKGEECPDEYKGKGRHETFCEGESIAPFWLPEIKITVTNLRKEAVLLSAFSPRIAGDIYLKGGKKIDAIGTKHLSSSMIDESGRVLAVGESITDRILGNQAVMVAQAFANYNCNQIEITVNGEDLIYPLDAFPSAVEYSRKVIGTDYKTMYENVEKFFNLEK